MCRNIKPIYNFDPPATDEEIRNAVIQFVRKISGYNKPAKVNEAAIENTVNEITLSAKKLFASLETKAAPRNRETEADRARAVRAKRFGSIET
jgi:hypothetical protein